MGGGSSGSQTTKNEFMPQEVDLRQLGLNYARQGMGQEGGAGFYGQSPAANMDPWVQQVRNQYMQGLTGNMPQNYGDWQQQSQQAAMYNPNANALSQMPTAAGGAINFLDPNLLRGLEAYSPEAGLAAGQKNLQTVLGPQIANTLAAGGGNPMSGAYAEAMTNAGAQMAMPITQQVMANQAAWMNPQIQGNVNAQLQQQGAQQNLQGMGYQGQLQGGLNQQQNVFNQAMQSPAAYNQLLQGLQGNMGAQMGLASMDQNQQQAEYLRRQGLWQQSVSGMYGGGGMSPISSTTNTNQGGGGFNTMGALGSAGTGAATGALMGSVVPGVGTAFGAAMGGLGGLFGGGFCWIADALYGEGSKDAQAARAWVSEGWQGEEADEFREWYSIYGERIAKALVEDEDFGDRHWLIYSRVFDEFVRKGKRWLKGAL